MLEKMQAIVEKTLAPVANKLSTNKILKAVSGGFGGLLAIIMVGAIASLLAGLNFEAYQNLITSIGLKSIFTYISTYTTNMIALYVVFSIARGMAEQLACKAQAVQVGVIALMAFLLTIPTGVGEGETAVASAIDTTYFGSAGIFGAMILGVLVAYLYNIFVEKNIVIKMPDGVPPQIAAGFSGILPALFITVVTVVIRQLCALTSFGTFNGLIYGVLRAPLSALTESPITFAVFCLLCNLFWFFGIHGGMVVMPFLSMLYMAPALENLEALAAGQPMPNLLTNTWWFTFVQIGGSGAVAGLAICMLLMAKSERYKSLGRLAVLPALCGISEPIVFGFPLMLNATMFIPMIVCPLVNFILTYVMTIVGVLPYLNGIQLSTGTPVVLAGLVAGGWVAAVWQVVLVAIDFVIYLPFFLTSDKQALAEEKAAAAQ